MTDYEQLAQDWEMMPLLKAIAYFCKHSIHGFGSGDVVLFRKVTDALYPAMVEWAHTRSIPGDEWATSQDGFNSANHPLNKLAQEALLPLGIVFADGKWYKVSTA